MAFLQFYCKIMTKFHVKAVFLQHLCYYATLRDIGILGGDTLFKQWLGWHKATTVMLFV